MNSQMKQTQGEVWKGPECRSPVLVKLGKTPSQTIDLFPAQKLSKSHPLRFFLEASSCKHDRLLTYFLASLPSLEDGDGGGGEGG